MRNLFIVGFFVFAAIFFIACTRTYDKVEYISEKALEWQPLHPGDTLTFINVVNDSVDLYLTEPDYLHKFQHASNNGCQDCDNSFSVMRENVYIKSSYIWSFTWSNVNNLVFSTELSWFEEYQTGSDIIGLTLHLHNNGDISEIKIIADTNNEPVYQDFFNQYSKFNFSDTLMLDNKLFFNVYASTTKPEFYYSKKEGIIAYEIDSVLWMNAKYK